VRWQIDLAMINPSQMKIALVIAMWNAIVVASLKQNKFSVLDWLKTCTFYGCSCLVVPCLLGHNVPTPISAPWRMNDKWSRNNFLLGFNSLTNHCRNPRLGPATKARACKVAGQEGSTRVTSHAPGNVGECEGMNPHIPKWALTLGVGLPVDPQWTLESLDGNCRGQNSLD